MSVLVSDDPRDDSGDRQVCGSRDFRDDRGILGVRCERPVRGRVIWITFPNKQLVHLCEIEVRGSHHGKMHEML